MKEKEQSSIEWLIEEINIKKAWADPEKIQPIVEKAKVLHKKEIIEAFDNAREKYTINDYGTSGYANSEDYYNEKYSK